MTSCTTWLVDNPACEVLVDVDIDVNVHDVLYNNSVEADHGQSRMRIDIL